MSDSSPSHLALVERWAELYNTDVERLVHEVYAPEATIGGQVWGPERLLKLERRVLAAAPKRRCRVLQAHVAGDVVTVEGEMLDADRADWKLPFCAVLTIADGKVVSDNTYAEFSQFPGFG
jgi:hypothetical protein